MDQSIGGSNPSYQLTSTLLDNIMDQATIDLAEVGKATALDPLFFTQGNAGNKSAIHSTVIGGGSYFEDTTNDVPFIKAATVNAANYRTTLVSNFFKNLNISRTFMQDEQLDAVKKAINQQAMTWVASRDRKAFSVYGNGFTTQTTIDGAAVFSNSHLNENGDTVDNLETGSLTDANLNIGVVSLRGQLSQTGVSLGYTPKGLLVPNVLDQQARAITKSVLRAGSGINDQNYWSEMYPNLQVKYSQFLDAYSTTAWFLVGGTNGIYRWEREAFNTKLRDWTISDNDMYTYKMRAREAVDSIEYSGLLGSLGTTA